MKHTPIYTETNKEDIGNAFFRTYINDAHNDLIAECYDEKEAEHIVKCVNAHEALVDAIEGVLKAIKFSGWNIDDSRWKDPIWKAERFLEELKAAGEEG